MGLQEKRKIKELQELALPDIKKEVDSLCGADITWEIDWDSFAASMDSLNCMDSYGFQYILRAFKSICIDDLGKNAVRENVRKITFKKAQAIGDMKLTFENSVLEIAALQEGSGWEGYYSEEQIRTLLEKSL